MADVTPAPIGFQIIALHVTSFSLDERSAALFEEVGFRITLQHRFDAENDVLTVDVELGIGPADQEDPAIAQLRLECSYQLFEYEKWLVAQPEDKRQPGVLPSGLAVTFNSISISTTRGVLYERLRGTPLQNLVLPVIDPASFQEVS